MHELVLDRERPDLQSGVRHCTPQKARGGAHLLSQPGAQRARHFGACSDDLPGPYQAASLLEADPVKRARAQGGSICLLWLSAFASVRTASTNRNHTTRLTSGSAALNVQTFQDPTVQSLTITICIRHCLVQTHNRPPFPTALGLVVFLELSV